MTHTHQPVFTGAALWVHSGSLACFEKCNFNSPDSSVYLEKLLFECKIHCKTLPFKRTKTKILKKFAGSRQKQPQSACFSNGLQQQQIWINLGQFPKAAMNTEMCGLNWMTLRLKCEDDGTSKLKKTSIPINTDTLGEDLQLVFQTLVHE